MINRYECRVSNINRHKCLSYLSGKYNALVMREYKYDDLNIINPLKRWIVINRGYGNYSSDSEKEYTI